MNKRTKIAASLLAAAAVLPVAGVTVGTSAAPAQAAPIVYGLKTNVPAASVYVWIPGGKKISSIGCRWKDPRNPRIIRSGGCRALVVVVDSTRVIRRVKVLIPALNGYVWATQPFYAPYTG